MRFLFHLFLFAILMACVDPLHIDVDKISNYNIYVDGTITNRPGPYLVRINRTFDIESKEAIKTPFSVRKVVLSDDEGNEEVLTETTMGVYQSDVAGIQGKIGGVYKLRVEYLNRVYESMPDTILSPGEIDSAYFRYNRNIDRAGQRKYGFDIFLTSDADNGSHLMWTTIRTFRADTRPELIPFAPPMPKTGCNPLPNRTCNFLPLCTGLVNVGTTREPRHERMAPCSCCTCWYSIPNDGVILNDASFSMTNSYIDNKVDRVDLNMWYFSYKVYVRTEQRRLSDLGYSFWRTVRDQRSAVGSLFQPITGRIPSNFVQTSGDPTPIFGLFYAAGIASRTMEITRGDVPDGEFIPFPKDAPIPAGGYPVDAISCFDLFPNATNMQPGFWVDGE